MCAVCMCNVVTAATSSNTGKLSKLSSTSTRNYTKDVEAHYSPARARCNDAAAAAVAARGAVAAVTAVALGLTVLRRTTARAGARCMQAAQWRRQQCGGGPTAFSFHF